MKKKFIVTKVNTMIVFSLILFSVVLLKNPAVAAAAPVTVNTVDYIDENLIINNNGSTKIYYALEADAAKDKWEVIEADAGATTSIDLSWLTDSIDNELKIKGDDGVKATVTIKERTDKLEVSINYLSVDSIAKTSTIGPLLNIMTTAGTATKPILYNDLEWKKGDTGNWKDVSLLTVAQLEKFQIKGTDLFFRIKAINANTVSGISPDGFSGNRVSKEAKLKIAKKASPMVVGIDGSRFTAAIKYGKEYRITTSNGSTNVTTNWIPVKDKSIKNLPLATIYASNANGTTIPFPGSIIEIRDYSTSKAASSKITKITLNAQRTLPGTITEGKAPYPAVAGDNNIYINYNGTTNVSITVPSASTSNPYEYTIVKPGSTFSIEKATWTSITKNTEYKITATKAVDGGDLYIRQKEIKSKEATNSSPAVAYALASTYGKYRLSYPSVPKITDGNLTFIKGFTNDLTFTIKLNELGKLPFETVVKSIKLGSKDLLFSTSVTPDLGGGAGSTSIVYTMTVTLKKDSLEELPVSANKPITIYYGSGSDKTSVKLTVKNPTPALPLTASPTLGSATGKTAILVTSPVASGNKLVYTIDDAEVKDKKQEEKITTGIDYTSGSDITVTASKYVTVYEVNSTTNNIVKYKSIAITADNIK
ncbi:MAG: hypothetical protein K0S47_800 [Herbinix sp.]|jgi:hypothetical protein|nr:hypothetical protein [Herbinix sp.]